MLEVLRSIKIHLVAPSNDWPQSYSQLSLSCKLGRRGEFFIYKHMRCVELNFVKCLELLGNGVTRPSGPQKNILLILHLDCRLGSFLLLSKYASEFSKFSVFLGDLPTITNESMLAYLMGEGRRN